MRRGPALGWGVCDPDQPEEPAAALLAAGFERASAAGGARTRVLIDTGPDLREQLIDAGANWLDGVLYTHEHADHTHGIDDLRALFIHKRKRRCRRLRRRGDRAACCHCSRFGYCFATPPGSDYPPILNEHRV